MSRDFEAIPAPAGALVRPDRGRGDRPAPGAAVSPAADTAGSAGRASAPAYDAGAGLLRAFDTNDRITRYLVEHLDDAVWHAAPPGRGGRTVAAIVAHVHAVRGMWLKAAGVPAPAPVDKATVTRAEAGEALGASHAALRAVVAAALAGTGRVKGFSPDVAGFVAYCVAHEAHHRGQVAMLARQLGHPLPKAAGFGLWEWGSRAKEAAPA